MIAQALLSVILFAAPTPRVASSATAYVFTPRLDRLDGVRTFTALAGKKTAMMKSVVWSEEVLPLLGVDVTSPESLAAAGIAGAGPLTTSFTPAGIVACVQLSAPAEFTRRAGNSYYMTGPKWSGTLPNAKFGAVNREGASVAAGYVQRGNVGCVIKSAKGVGGNLMFEAEKLLGSPKVPASWKNASVLPGALFVASPEFVASARAVDAVLTVDARAVKLPVNVPTLAPAGSSPYANLSGSGVLSLKAKVDPVAVLAYARGFAQQLLSYCRGCSDKTVSDAVVALTSELTGNVFLRVDSLAVSGEALRTDEGKYFSVRHAWAAELKNPAAVKALLSRMPRGKGVERTSSGVQLQLELGTVELRLVGSHVIVANDGAALEAAAALIERATVGKLAHSLELDGDPKPVARALKRISLLEVLGSKQLAGLFAVGMEFGPLMSASARAQAWADAPKDGVMRAQAVWTLLAAPVPASTSASNADAGVTP